MSQRPVMTDGMVIYAFRYALGRASYAVGECVDYLILNWKYLEPSTREVIRRDIMEAFAEDRYGMEMDRRQWERVLDL